MLVDVGTLIESCRGGDPLAWEQLVRRYQGRVFAVTWHYMRNSEEARDMAQEVFIRIYRSLESFHGSRAFVPWMLSLTRNACIDRLRELKARPPAHDVPVEDDTELMDRAASPEEMSDRESRRRLISRALDDMNDKSREIILLKDIQGLELQEIAEMLSIPVGTAKSRSSRARIELAAKIRTLDPSYGT
jgi:RNA polymerase sigma-70 factor (ECF subfamily)